jgi:hypothetical protein
MNQTRANDMLIEMITPKVQEIEKKFSRGEALTQEDINTLLLKSQFNHINHLDQKLDEVTADCGRLRLDFEVRFAGLESKFYQLENRLEGKFSSLETKFANLETRFEIAQVKMQQTIITTMKWYIGSAALVLTVLKALDMFVK